MNERPQSGSTLNEKNLGKRIEKILKMFVAIKQEISV